MSRPLSFALDDGERRSRFRLIERRLYGLELRRLLDRLAIGRDMQLTAIFVNTLDGLGRDDHRASPDPVTGIHEEVLIRQLSSPIRKSSTWPISPFRA